MAIRFSLRHLPLLLAPPLRSSFSSFSTYFSLHTYRPPPCLPASTSSVLRHTPPCPLSSLAGWSVRAGLGVCLNLVMHGKGDEHLLVGQAVSSPLQTLTSNYSRAWAFLSLLSAPPLCCFFVYESPFLWPSISNSDWIHFWFPGWTNLVSKCPNLAKDSDSNSKTTCTGV